MAKYKINIQKNNDNVRKKSMKRKEQQIKKK